MPPWFINQFLVEVRKQVRGTSLDAVRSAASAIEMAGNHASKAAIARQLGLVCCKPLTAEYSRRTIATHEEWVILVHELEFLTKRTVRRASTHEVVIRDALIILLAILSGAPTGSIAKSSERECRDVVRTIATSNRPRVSEVVNRLVVRYGDLSSVRRGDSESDYFVGFRGRLDLERSARKVLSAGMKSMDRRLHRSVRSFFQVASLDLPVDATYVRGRRI